MSSVLYVGVDLHERESQLAIFEQDGNLLEERRLPTGDLYHFLSSLSGEKRVAIESVGFVYPIYDKLSTIEDRKVIGGESRAGRPRTRVILTPTFSHKCYEDPT